MENEKIAGDPDLYDADGNFDEFAAKVKNLASFKLVEQSLKCPELEGNQIFDRIKSRLIKQHLANQKVRKYGLSAE